MVKLLIDENVEKSIANLLNSLNIDVKLVDKELTGLEDNKILTHAVAQNRIIITNDKDFGAMVYHQKLKHVGIILLRFQSQQTATKVKTIQNILKKFNIADFKNKFTVISESGVRIGQV